jgi:hypothetical protein
VTTRMTICTEVGYNDSNGQRQVWCRGMRWLRRLRTSNSTLIPTTVSRLATFQQRVSAPTHQEWPGDEAGRSAKHDGASKRATLVDSANVFVDALSDDYTAAAVFAQESSNKANALTVKPRSAI